MEDKIMSIETAPEHESSPLRTLINKRKLLQTIPLSYPAIWNRMRRGEFPMSVKLDDDDGRSRTFWYLDEVVEWINKRPRSQLKPASDARATDGRRRRDSLRAHRGQHRSDRSLGSADAADEVDEAQKNLPRVNYAPKPEVA